MSNETRNNSSAALQNGSMRVEISRHGAEMVSLRADGREYLWDGNPAYWKRHSPILFPIVGSLWNGSYRHAGHEYAMSQHGFARDMDFVLLDQTETATLFELRSSEITRTNYPFDFALRVGYEIEGERSIAVRWEVENLSDAERMYFSIGAHPAFLLRPGITSAIEKQVPVGGYFRMAKNGSPLPALSNRIFGRCGCMTDKEEQVDLCEGGLLPIKSDTFSCDTIVAENSQVDEVTLLSALREPIVRLRFNAPLFGLWAPRGDEYSPFVCIEPWYGRADRVEFDGDLADKVWGNALSPRQTFCSVYHIDILGHGF